jgi:hypothetical protein
MGLPGSKLSRREHLPSKPLKSSRPTASSPVTVLGAPSKVVIPQPKVTTFSNTNIIKVKKTPAQATTLKSISNPSKSLSNPQGFKRPSIAPRPTGKPLEFPVDKPARKSVDKSVDDSRYASILNDKATDSTQPIKKYAIKKRKVWAGLAFACFSLAVTGFLVYLNLPDISVRVRANELGISTSLPAYRPDGFSVQGIAEVQGDTLTVRFASPDDSFTFTARRSSFDPYQVADYARSNMPDAESVFGGGLTVFVKGSDAIWANGGILYTISGSNTLTPQQIIKIAISTD